MKFYIKNWAYIFLSPGYNPKQHTFVIDNGQTKFTAVGLDPSNINQAISVAKSLQEDGVQMIELCGGFGPIWVAKIKEITNNQIPVGSTMYGPEDRVMLLKIIRGAEIIFPEE